MAGYKRKFAKDLQYYDKAKADNGYTFFAPTFGTDAWLIDMNGRIVNHWEMKNPPASHGILMPNGNVMWQAKGPDSLSDLVGAGTELVEVDWDGNEVWRYDEFGLNHDFAVLDNGNIIVNVYIPIPEDIAKQIKGGIPGTELTGGKIYSSCFKEITREGKAVWEWKFYEHMDLEKEPICPLCPRTVWGFNNSLDILPDGNILATKRFMNEVIIIDRKSGDIKWSWGRDKEIGHPHSVSYLENGNVLLFDNGMHRKQVFTSQIGDIAGSRVVEVNPKTDEIVWEYKDPLVPNFFSAICSGAQRLSNGNTLICEATKGHLFEVTKEKEIVWDYYNPFVVKRNPFWDWTLNITIWMCHRYKPDYPAFEGKNLDPEQWEWVIRKKTEKDIEKENVLKRLESLGY